MKPFLTILALSTLVFCGRPAMAGGVVDASERAAVLKVVDAFFSAMEARDADAIRKLYQPKTQFVSGAPSKEGYALTQQSIEEFIPAAKQAPGAFLERTWSPEVLLDGRVAVVWARHDFHTGSKFSHNGRDCYVLLKTDQGWKIVSLVFSVEPAPHTENPAGPPK